MLQKVFKDIFKKNTFVVNGSDKADFKLDVVLGPDIFKMIK